MKSYFALTALLLAASSVALADAPPTSCTQNGCDLRSNLLVLAEGDAVHEFTAAISYCDFCTYDDDGTFRLTGDLDFEFGPYDVALCNPADGTIHQVVSGLHLTVGAGGGGPQGDEATYVPDDPNQELLGTLATPLRTACVTPGNLDYEIPWISLTGALGAQSGDGTAGHPLPRLDLPERVRAEQGAVLIQRLDLPQIRLTQGLGFQTQRTEAAASTLRIWPEGLPFRIGPHVMTFDPTRVGFTTGGTGPTPYTPAPPNTGGLPGPGLALLCDPTKPDWTTDPCTATQISNAGYLDSPSWSLPSGGFFDVDGMSLDLELAGAGTIVYEPLFPRGTWVRLDPPASVSIQQGEIVSGAFDHGQGWLRISDGERCTSVDRERSYPLRGGGAGPRLEPGGGLLAGVEDLTATQPMDWTVNTADGLGCGTLFVPPPLTAGYPQQAWLAAAPAAPTVLDRGIYAGFNYNRNRVCRDSAGIPQDTFCTTDADCDSASGESCTDAGWSPFCPALPVPFNPQWNTVIEGTPKNFAIGPATPGEADREMAFFVRRSGVSGVFDGGDDLFNLSTASGFDIDFETFGLTMKQSRAEGQDTITRGGVNFDWPSDTTFPFEEMEMCDCGGIDGAAAPQQLVQNTLGYWNAELYPYSYDFTENLGPNDTCPGPAETACGQSGQSAAVCVTALTPIPRFLPDPTTEFPVTPSGETGTFLPFSDPEMGFDEDLVHGQPPYTYQLESFVLSDWPGNATASESLVRSGAVRFGYYDTSGDLSIPYFGLTAAGIQVQPEDREPANPLSDFFHPANVHEEGGPLNAALQVERDIAADSILSRFKVEYFGPEATADPDDGDDRAFFGRGTLFAFAEESDLDLGSVAVAGGMILGPDSILHDAADLGPAASLRLWGALLPAARPDLSHIMLATHLTGLYPDYYDDALAELTSERPYEPWALPDPATLNDDLLDTGAIDLLAAHDHAQVVFNTTDPGGENPTVTGNRARGRIVFSPGAEQVDSFRLSSDQSTGGRFYAFDGSLLEVDRHTKQSGMPITTLTREAAPGSGPNMELPGEQSIPFPVGGSTESTDSFSGIDWDFDYDVDTSVVPPSFEFKSLTGTLDLTRGGLSGMGFDKLGATLAFYANGDWYFSAGVRVKWAGYGINGDILLGNTQDMTPLRQIDPDVASFLAGVSKFDGAYVGAGLSVRLFDYGCPFRVSAGADVAGWYISQSFGGKVRGWLSGTGACLVSVRGDLTLLGGEVNDLYKITGKVWVGGGIGFCDPEDWNSPADVLDDDFCAACVISGRARGHYPPSDLDLKFSGPHVDCSL